MQEKLPRLLRYNIRNVRYRKTWTLRRRQFSWMETGKTFICSQIACVPVYECGVVESLGFTQLKDVA